MLKTMLVVIYAKMLYRSFIPTTLKLFFYLPTAQENL